MLRRLDGLEDEELLSVYREVARRVQPIYAKRYRAHYETGMAAARAKGRA